MNYKAERKRLCDVQHEEYVALQRDEGKTYDFDSGKDYVMFENHY